MFLLTHQKTTTTEIAGFGDYAQKGENPVK